MLTATHKKTIHTKPCTFCKDTSFTQFYTQSPVIIYTRQRRLVNSVRDK